MTDWKISKRKLGGYPCIEHRRLMASWPFAPEPAELTLAGRYGEIWQYSATHFRAVVRRRDYEQLVTFPAQELRKWIKRLQVPLDAALQVGLAENFNSSSEYLGR